MSKIRIAILSRNFKSNAGGGEHYAVSLTRKLAKKYDIHIFSQSHDKLDGVTFHTVPTPLQRPRWINLVWFNLYTWAKCRHFPIIHSHEMVSFANIVTMHVRCSTPNFNQHHGINKILKKIKFLTSIRKLIYWWIEKKQLSPKKGKAIVVVSEALKNNIRDVYQYDTNDYTIIPPGVDQPTILSKDQSRKTLELPQHGYYLLLASNDFISKGLKPIIKSLLSLPDEISLLVAGKDKQHPFKKLANKLGVSHRVFFLGSVKNMSLAYSACDILIHPSTYDTYGMVALEAMSHKKPVIISNSNYCGISHDLTDQTLMLNDPESPEEISNAIYRIFSSTDLTSYLINSGKTYSDKHSWEKASEKYIKIYSNLIH